MTTSVLITANCGEDNYVVVSVTTVNTGNTFTLMDGETAERYVHGEMSVTVREAPRVPRIQPDFNG